MPAIYEYFGLLFLFYSNEHVPVHVHVRLGEYETAYELIVNDGKLVALMQRKIKGKELLPQKKSKQAEKLISIYFNEILQKWFTYFVLNKEINFEKINDKL
jgi:predicted nucleic acid-binding protein